MKTTKIRGAQSACALAMQHLHAPVKLLGNGNLSKRMQVQVDATSESAKEKVEKAGGSVVIETASAGADFK